MIWQPSGVDFLNAKALLALAEALRIAPRCVAETDVPYVPPVMKINSDVRDLCAFTFDDFTLEDYDAQPSISTPIAV